MSEAEKAKKKQGELRKAEAIKQFFYDKAWGNFIAIEQHLSEKYEKLILSKTPSKGDIQGFAVEMITLKAKRAMIFEIWNERDRILKIIDDEEENDDC